jgi:hypothetical protein
METRKLNAEPSSNSTLGDSITIESIIEKHKNVGNIKTKSGDDRLFYLDEENNILYCFGPSSYVRQAKQSAESDRVMIVEYENGPYLQVGDNVYGDMIIKDFIMSTDHGIVVTCMILESKEIPSEGISD